MSRAAVLTLAALIGSVLTIAGLPASPSPVVADDPTVASAPPVVVKTVPVAGTVDVDPTTKEVKVTFSKEMADESWSWVTDDRYGLKLPVNGDVAYDKDKKTCVMPVKLEPGKTYAVWINSEAFENFKDSDGRAAVPYLLVFSTKAK